jgi:aspartate aminotransferase
MTGFRIGVSAGPQWLISAMTRLQSHITGNACTISQAAAVAAFTGPQDFLLDWRERFRARRDAVVAAINAIPGLSTPVPDGAFYCMVDATPHMARFGDDRAGHAPAGAWRGRRRRIGLRRAGWLPHLLRRR